MDAFVSLNDDQTEVITEYARPQNPPQPPGYAVVDDTDPRLLAFRLLHPAVIDPTQTS